MRKNLTVALGMLFVVAPAYGQTPAPRQAPRPPNAEAVTVTGVRPGVTTSIDSRAYLIDRDLGAATGTLADALRNVPSVQVDLEGNVSLRGDQNVQILVDGKPSPLFAGAARPQAILNFPARDIERVEVMTTPSAAFSADGAGGVINIITRNPNRPMTTASVSAQYGKAGSARFAGNYSRRAGKLTITASATRNGDEVKNSRLIDRRATPVSAAVPLESVTSYEISNDHSVQFANLNVTYDATPKWQLSGNALTGDVDVTRGLAQSRYVASTAGIPVTAFDTITTLPDFGVSFSGFGSTLTRKFDGQEHDLSAAYNFSRNSQFVLLQGATTQSIPPAADVFERNFTGYVTRQDKVRLNYRRPLPGSAKLALGYELQDDDNDYDNFYALGPSLATLVVDSNVSNRFAFQQKINSVFGTYERPFGPLTTQWGLRVESTNMTIAETVERDYLRVYPTLNFGYKIDDNNSLRGGYSRRVQRPPPNQLNPFRIQTPAATLLLNEGNPDLEPQETDSFEFGYQYRKGQTSYLATVYSRIAHDEFTPVTRDLGGGVSVIRQENLGSSRSGGFELVANGRLTSTLKYSLSTNTFWKEIDAGNLGFAGARSAIGVSGNSNLNWDATAKDALQLNVIATGKRLTAQGYVAPFWTLNLGWRHKFNDRVSTTLTLRDVLDGTRYKVVGDTPTLYFLDVTKNRSARAAWFQLTYTFGESKPSDPAFDFGTVGGGLIGN